MERRLQLRMRAKGCIRSGCALPRGPGQQRVQPTPVHSWLEGVVQLGSVYSLDPNALGQFDIVLFLGVLYHLRYPLLAADKLRAVTSGELLIETPGSSINASSQPARHRPRHARSPRCPHHSTTSWQFYRGNGLSAGPEQLVRAKCYGSAARFWFCGLRDWRDGPLGNQSGVPCDAVAALRLR